MVVFVNSLGLGITITLLMVCIYQYKEIDDVEYMQLASVHFVNTALFVMSLKGTEILPAYLYVLMTIVSWVVLLWDAIYGKKHFTKLNEWNHACRLLKQCNIDYVKFKKMSRPEQIDLLEQTYVTWDDGTTDKLIEEESDWNWVKPVLKKEGK